MGLLVEYTLKDASDTGAQAIAMKALCDGLKQVTGRGFSYQGFSSDDPTKFFGVLQFDSDDEKQRFLDSDAFKIYQEGARDRLVGPPVTTSIKGTGSTL